MKMSEKKRVRRTHSIRQELIVKSREAALAAVQIFNSPMITFKSEVFIVLMNIAWTYMLHAYCRGQGIEYRYFSAAGKRRRFSKTKHGAHKHWELERCLDEKLIPIDNDTKNNLKFLIGIRHEIEHQMTSRIDDALSAKFQACCLNYNEYIKRFFGNECGIDKYLAFSLQFTSINAEQTSTLLKQTQLPAHIRSCISNFEDGMTEAEYNHPHFAYRVAFERILVNNKRRADKVIEFIDSKSELAASVQTTYAVIKRTEGPKFRPSTIVAMMRSEGFARFYMHAHTTLWKSLNAKEQGDEFGVNVEGCWYWYENWVEVVRKHCRDNADTYGGA